MKTQLLFWNLLLGLVAYSASAQNSLLWEITKPNGSVEKSYLFGTYHLVGSAYLKDHATVKNAYEASNTVVVETVIDSSRLMEFAMLGMMEQSLRSLVDSAEYQLLKSELEPLLGVDLMVMDKFKPITLSSLYAMNMATENTPEEFLYQGTPIDAYFAYQGKNAEKEVIQLEDMLEQAKMLYNMDSVEKQANDLVQMVLEKDQSTSATIALIEAYQKEDLQKMLELSKQWKEEYGDITALVDDRNVNWIPKLETVLEKGNAFIAVGALHLPGKKGLIQLLQDEGYILTPVK